jgi:hypothetical protein
VCTEASKVFGLSLICASRPAGAGAIGRCQKGRLFRAEVAEAAVAAVGITASAALFPATHNALVSVGRRFVNRFRQFYNYGYGSKEAEALESKYCRTLEANKPQVRKMMKSLIYRVSQKSLNGFARLYLRNPLDYRNGMGAKRCASS